MRLRVGDKQGQRERQKYIPRQKQEKDTRRDMRKRKTRGEAERQIETKT